MEASVVNKDDTLSNDDVKDAADAVRKDEDTPSFLQKDPEATEDIA